MIIRFLEKKVFTKRHVYKRAQPFYFTWKNKVRRSLVKSLSFDGFTSLAYCTPFSSKSLDSTYGFLTSSTSHVRKASSIHGLLGLESRSHRPTPKHSFWAPKVVQCISSGQRLCQPQRKWVQAPSWIAFHFSLVHLASACSEPDPVLDPRIAQMN